MKPKSESKNGPWMQLERSLLLQVFAMMSCFGAVNSPAQSYSILHRFDANAMGLHPSSSLIEGPAGALYGLSHSGGSNSYGNCRGTVFKVNPDGSGYQVLHSFCGSPQDGSGPRGDLIISGTTLYGTTEFGGSNGWGTVFKINTDGSEFTILKHFAKEEGVEISRGVKLSGATLYGTAAQGGSYGHGTVFKLNTNGSGFAVLKHFTGSDGDDPYSGLVVSGDILYGTTVHGGSMNSGTVFRINTDGSGFAILKDFVTELPNFNGPVGTLALSGSTLYGAISQGTGEGRNGGLGAIFRINTDGTGYRVLKDFYGGGNNSAWPHAGVIISGSRLYGTTEGNPDYYNWGTVFSLNTDGTDYTVLHRFVRGSHFGRALTNAEGALPQAAVMLSGATLYGTTTSGGNYGCGTLFKLNTNGSDFAVMKDLAGPDGINPLGTLAASGATLYGVTESGGRYGNQGGSAMLGTLFRINRDGGDFKILKNFAGAEDGEIPRAGLVVSGTSLFGTTFWGGFAWYGTVFKLNTDGDGYTVLHSFANDGGGGNPAAELLLSGSILYGTTSGGGDAGNGTVFKVNTDGSGFSVLHSFTKTSGSSWTNQDGRWPKGKLCLSGTKLFGRAEAGGKYGYGTIFRLNTDGSGFTTLKEFTAADGGGSLGTLVLSDEALYGLCSYGNGLFRINTDSGEYQLVKQFVGEDGLYAQSLTLFGTMLFGTTQFGGVYGKGTVFELNTDGSDFSVLKQFTGLDGANPVAGLALSGTMLYGMTSDGVVFSLAIPPEPPLISGQPQSHTAEADSTVEFSVNVTNSFPTTFQWFFDETNFVGCSTNWWLELTNCDFSQSGSYTVIVTNVFGAVTSAPVMLNVIPAVERRPVPAINLTGDAGASLNVEFTDALGPLANWLMQDVVDVTNSPQYWFDLNEPLPPQRFYRAWQSGTPTVAPSLSLSALVPAITLTGNLGDTLRLDYINAIGPTDAWVTLDTVTLTNTSQLYFDVSSIGQPRRLYRIVSEQ